ncbi:MAG: ATP-binding cassette domain-containing protein [Clostridiales bacterium]|nr:ATP-binding cassette domain-containing protein [Clostridiales bacterium]
MIQANNVTVQFGGKALFERVNAVFSPGNCYGIIGANGAGKSTFLKVLSGELEPQKGEVSMTPGERLSVLEQDHFKYDEYEVVRTVLMGNPRLIEIMEEKDALYAKPDFSEEDGIKAGELEAEFADLDGWNAEADAEFMLNKLGVKDEFHYIKMADLATDLKVKVLLAKALFGNPDILLLDEPTNHLDLSAIRWLENFLLDFENTVIVVSHDRHFLNKVCTHICDVDFGKIQMYAGNYDFWYEYTQMRQRQQRDQNKKNEQKIKELQEFIQRFSANASKSKQATSRKKQLDALEMIDMPVSSRRFPYVDFKPDRACGNDLLRVDSLTKTIAGRKVLDNISFVIHPREKVAFVGSDAVAKTTLFKILMGEEEPDSGSFKWGVTTSQEYFPSDNSRYFDGVDYNLIDWLRQYTTETLETDIRSWLGRMLFSGDDALKRANVLSGGERVRCMLCKMMLSGANVLLLDEPTNHLDLESITALNNGLIRYSETVLFTSHDHQFIETIANRIIEISGPTIIDRKGTYEEFLAAFDEEQLKKY